MKRVEIVFLAVSVTAVLFAAAPPVASANQCRESAEKTGNYSRRTPDNTTGLCELPVTRGTGAYVIMLGIVRESVEPGIACAEVSEAGLGDYSNTKCEGSHVEGGEFIKVVEDEGENGSGTPFVAPALVVCKKVPTGSLGLFTEAKCETNAKTGSFSWSTPDSAGNATWYCLLARGGTNRYTESLCETTSATGGFEAKLFKESFPKELATLLLSVLKSKVAGAENIIDCTGGSATGAPVAATLTTEIVNTYTGCVSVKPTKCEVANKGGTAGVIVTGKLVTHLVSLQLVQAEPESGKAFVEVEYKNKGSETCSLNKEALPVEGTQSCDWEAGAHLAEVGHLLTCKSTGSKLKLGSNTATYEGSSEIHLEGSPYWKIQ